jgi:hypothetical protein
MSDYIVNEVVSVSWFHDHSEKISRLLEIAVRVCWLESAYEARNSILRLGSFWVVFIFLEGIWVIVWFVSLISLNA